ncbi:MAG: Hpt domain-containing protein [Eubacteriales bacterium]|nr:Hpt domain-containing protein [Eubacteriales bacterium]
MLTIDTLRRLGVNTSDGLGRCMNNEAFYLRLVNMALDDQNFGKLEEAVKNGDKTAAFEAAHALKGVLGNLSLTPLYEATSEMTELLRAGRDADYPALLSGILRQREELLSARGE